jgi:hypothetical protein
MSQLSAAHFARLSSVVLEKNQQASPRAVQAVTADATGPKQNSLAISDTYVNTNNEHTNRWNRDDISTSWCKWQQQAF